MSVQKLVSEAEKLLDKGKIPEGISKLNQALQLEPLNQFVATKLANVYVQDQKPAEAAKVYSALALRLSELGKSQIAIAIYKQAIELLPNDIALRVRFAQECESVGKLGDAFLQTQVALQHYLRRKKYFDAINLMPLLVRTQPNDEKIKLAWLEILQLCQVEQKLNHLLVAFTGPPGIVSDEFQVGGEPSTLSPVLYEGVKRLVPYFPRNPWIAYAVAWAAYRRGQMGEFYHFLQECYRREPEFGLATLLYSRVLAEDKKLNESLFVYGCFKERMAIDKSADALTLARLVEAFLEKNGWIKFIEDTGEILDAQGFLGLMTGIAEKEKSGASKLAKTDALTGENIQDQKNIGARAADWEDKESGNIDLPPAEIEIRSETAEEEATMEIVLPTGNSGGKIGKPEKKEKPAGGKKPEDSSGFVEGFSGGSVELTALIKGKDIPAAMDYSSASMEKAGASETESSGAVVAPAEAVAPKKMSFDPREQAELPKPPVEQEERTKLFSPMEVIDAMGVMRNRELAKVDTRSLEIDPKNENKAVPAAVIAPAEINVTESLASKWKDVQADGSPTQIFSPLEAVQANVDSRRPMDLDLTVKPPPPPLPKPEGENAAQEKPQNLPVMEEATRVEASPSTEAPPPSELSNPPAAELFIPPTAAGLFIPPTAEMPIQAPPDSEGPAFMPIPDFISQAPSSEATELVDLGDDLLEGPTRIFTMPIASEATGHLLKEIKQEIKEKSSTHLNVELLMKKAERYIAKRNYYLARKSLRHAQHLGADEETVKARMRDIRKLELPEGLYHSISSDRVAKVDTSEVLDRLEREFDLAQPHSPASAELGSLIDERIETIFRENDARTILDFGVGLHEMGLFRQAESLFIRLVTDSPEFAFDAYYLAAVSKISRRDYAGAASILNRLSTDPGKTDLEKIQIYYALGETFEKMRQLDRSKSFFKKVAELDANYRNIRHKLEE